MVCSNDHGKLVLFDPLNQPGEWQLQQDNAFGGSCVYTQGAYGAIQSKPDKVYARYGQTDFSDFAVEVQMKIIRGDCGGIAFRNNGSDREYMFAVCQDGTYNLYFYSNTTNPKTLLQSTSSSVHQGLNQVNTIAVKAQGEVLRLYINQQLIDSATDNSQNTGSIGFLANSTTHPTEVIYTRARIWTFASQ
jgi:hypothetical protein